MLIEVYPVKNLWESKVTKGYKGKIIENRKILQKKKKQWLAKKRLEARKKWLRLAGSHISHTQKDIII